VAAAAVAVADAIREEVATGAGWPCPPPLV